MGKYENDVKQLLTLIGGKENIQAVSHCMTRMRFVLVDSKKANEEAIEELPSVKGTFTRQGSIRSSSEMTSPHFIMSLLLTRGSRA